VGSLRAWVIRVKRQFRMEVCSYLTRCPFFLRIVRESEVDTDGSVGRIGVGFFLENFMMNPSAFAFLGDIVVPPPPTPAGVAPQHLAEFPSMTVIFWALAIAAAMALLGLRKRRVRRDVPGASPERG
jgi:hypothetical protein